MYTLCVIEFTYMIAASSSISSPSNPSSHVLLLGHLAFHPPSRQSSRQQAWTARRRAVPFSPGATGRYFLEN
jgi:hypothetical protein